MAAIGKSGPIEDLPPKFKKMKRSNTRKQIEEFAFDSLECAITKLAPECRHCGQKIVGHGVQVDRHIYCCAHCARQENETGIKDRAAG